MEKTKTYDVTESFKKSFVEALDDSNDSLNIKEAGMFDLLDAASGKDNSKFSKEDAKAAVRERLGE